MFFPAGVDVYVYWGGAVVTRQGFFFCECGIVRKIARTEVADDWVTFSCIYLFIYLFFNLCTVLRRTFVFGGQISPFCAQKNITAKHRKDTKQRFFIVLLNLAFFVFLRTIFGIFFK